MMGLWLNTITLTLNVRYVFSWDIISSISSFFNKYEKKKLSFWLIELKSSFNSMLSILENNIILITKLDLFYIVCVVFLFCFLINVKWLFVLFDLNSIILWSRTNISKKRKTNKTFWMIKNSLYDNYDCLKIYHYHLLIKENKKCNSIY